MHTRSLGHAGPVVSTIGFGAAHLSVSDDRPDEDAAQALIHRALDRGVRLIDTADAYCLDESEKHHNERVVARAVAAWAGPRTEVVIATKGGIVRPEGRWEPNGSREHLAATIRESHALLGGAGPIGLWQHHSPDPKRPLDEALDVIAEAVEAGLIRHVGVSNYSVSQIEAAALRLPLVSVQNQYSPWHREPERDGTLAYAEQHGLAFLPWGPMGGKGRARRLDEYASLKTLAEIHDCSPQRVVIAWLRARSHAIFPIPGTTNPEHLDDLLAAEDMTLSAEEVAQIDADSVGG